MMIAIDAFKLTSIATSAFEVYILYDCAYKNINLKAFYSDPAPTLLANTHEHIISLLEVKCAAPAARGCCSFILIQFYQK